MSIQIPAYCQYIDEVKHLIGKRVLVRLDLNVPVENGVVLDSFRIQSAQETIAYLLSVGALPIVISHFGRPKGKDPKYSLAQIIPALKQIWNVDIVFLQHPVDSATDQLHKEIQEHEKVGSHNMVILLENTRFYPQETEQDEALAEAFASLADLFVMDGFGVLHRKHTTTYTIREYLPYYLGFLVKKELAILKKAVQNPHPPVVMITGGSKVSTKLEAILNLIPQIDILILNGGIAFTYMKAKGIPIGKSSYEQNFLEKMLLLEKFAQEHGVKIVIPRDMVCVTDISSSETEIYAFDSIPESMMAVDIGHETVEYFGELISQAGTVFWNGPCGIVEMEAFAQGSIALAKKIAKRNEEDSAFVSIIGGGETALAVHLAKVESSMTHISTGGGVLLEILEGKKIETLKDFY